MADTLGPAAAAQFLYHEARLLDERRFADWLDLWCDDALYWVPAGDETSDPTETVSLIFDDRRRLARRVAQLTSGLHHSQEPSSRTVHFVANAAVTVSSDGVLSVRSTLLVVEERGGLRLWPASVSHLLRATGEGLRIARKTVVLVNGDEPLDTLAILL